MIMNRATCGSYIAKIFMVVFNFFLFACGAVLVGVGSWVCSEDSTTFAELEMVKEMNGDDLLRSSSVVLVSFGCFAVLLSVFGFALAWTENPYFFVVYIIGLAICWTGMIIGGLLAIAFKDKMIEDVENNLLNNLDRIKSHYYGIAPNGDYVIASGAAWDRMQQKYDCCGVSDYHSYDKYQFTSNTTHYNGQTIDPEKQERVPFSCCSNFDYMEKFKRDAYEIESCDLNEQGCRQRIVRTATILIGLGVCFGMFMMFGTVFSFCLCQNPTKNI